MPLVFIPLLLLAFAVLVLLMLPFSILQRYRSGTARRRTRTWVALVNAGGMGVSVVIILTTAAISSMWVPAALTYTAAGLVGGCVLGVAGLWLTRWETSSGVFYHTPNRWLVLSITLAVALRLGFGVWRTWHAWHAGNEGGSWLAESGFAGSLAAGALVFGYYLTFWSGVWIRARR
jgi:hypothetical protein